MSIPIIAIVGAHNSGKTTFITKVIALLKEKGIKVCAIKHDPKGKAKTDVEGKDSYKMYQSGADQVILVSPEKITSFIRNNWDEDIYKIVDKLVLDDVELIILEGFKGYRGFDKFEVIRKNENRDLLLKNNPELKGVITDYYEYPLKFDINSPKEFVEFLIEKYLKK